MKTTRILYVIPKRDNVSSLLFDELNEAVLTQAYPCNKEDRRAMTFVDQPENSPYLFQMTVSLDHKGIVILPELIMTMVSLDNTDIVNLTCNNTIVVYLLVSPGGSLTPATDREAVLTNYKNTKRKFKSREKVVTVGLLETCDLNPLPKHVLANFVQILRAHELNVLLT